MTAAEKNTLIETYLKNRYDAVRALNRKAYRSLIRSFSKAFDKDPKRYLHG